MKRRDVAQPEASRLAPPQELPHRPPVRGPAFLAFAIPPRAKNSRNRPTAVVPASTISLSRRDRRLRGRHQDRRRLYPVTTSPRRLNDRRAPGTARDRSQAPGPARRAAPGRPGRGASRAAAGASSGGGDGDAGVGEVGCPTKKATGCFAGRSSPPGGWPPCRTVAWTGSRGRCPPGRRPAVGRARGRAWPAVVRPARRRVRRRQFRAGWKPSVSRSPPPGAAAATAAGRSAGGAAGRPPDPPWAAAAEEGVPAIAAAPRGGPWSPPPVSSSRHDERRAPAPIPATPRRRRARPDVPAPEGPPVSAAAVGRRRRRAPHPAGRVRGLARP